MKNYKYHQLMPNTPVEYGYDLFEVLNLTTRKSIVSTKSVLNKNEKELFQKFCMEQQRVTRLTEMNFLKPRIIEQRILVNKMAAFVKKRDAKELRTFGKLY